MVTALIELAASADYRDRADAGRALAVFAEAPEARDPLRRLVLDNGDTFVTLTTAEALLRRQDTAGFTIVAEALTSADPQQTTYIHDAATTVFQLFASDRDQALEACDALVHDTSPHVRQGAAELREMLTHIDPILHPHDPT
ncbi:hypothetical protein [Kribbella sp. NPDC003557]|uniref:hypothetical protein n=1 Tax=Kribbella sp. NPDC003557 TaxID=3154449 RepID=UPI0033BC176D